MKKIFMLIAISAIILPAYAACPLEEGGACKVAGVLSQPLQRTQTTSTPLVKEFGGTGARLQPSKNDEQSMQLREFGPRSTDYSYSTNCQFGICNKGGTRLFNQRKN